MEAANQADQGYLDGTPSTSYDARQQQRKKPAGRRHRNSMSRWLNKADKLKSFPTTQTVGSIAQGPSATTKKPLPGRGQPGGLDDPLRKGLSGARVKWYLRFLEMGYPPEEAKRKTLECRPTFSDTVLTHAPKRSSEKMASHQRSDAKRARKSISTFLGRNTHAKPQMAVLPKVYPRNILSPEQLTTLEECILSEVAKGHTTALVFEGIHFRSGYLLVDCGDESTADWLRDVASRLQDWKGIELMACLKENIPKARTINLFLPKSAGQSQEKTLALLKAQNAGLTTACWKVTHYKNEGSGQLMMALIDEGSYEHIRANGFELNFRFGKIGVRMLKYTPETCSVPLDNIGSEEENTSTVVDAAEINHQYMRELMDGMETDIKISPRDIEILPTDDGMAPGDVPVENQS